MATNNDWDWDSIKNDAGGQFSPLAQPGFHTAKLDMVDVRETKNAQGNTSYWLDLIFADEGTAFPKISHPISFKNPKGSWRKWHYMLMLKELGISEEKAKQAIQNIETKSGTANIVAAYHATFNRAAQKHPSVEIEVFESDNLNPKTGRPYLRADFKNPALAFGRDTKPAPAKEESILDSGDEITLDDGELDF